MPFDDRRATDGDAATLVDLSCDGAQVLVPRTVRPNQRLRMSMADEQRSLPLSWVHRLGEL